ncbi:MAG: TIR domain-containing protein [Clostridiales bacterium]|nr:TIR domain-containing protein [Clostridiales bacterium]
MGRHYYLGHGVKTDFNEAVKWFKMSSDQGDCNGQFLLAWCYMHGHGVSQNDREAERLYKLSSDQGYPIAQASLVRMYLNLGESLCEANKSIDNINTAKEYYEKALKAAKDYNRYRWDVKARIDKGLAMTNTKLEEFKKEEAIEAHISPRKDIFISYSHEDMLYKNELLKHLKMFKYIYNNTKWWDDSQIEPGAKWKDEIKAAMERAKIIIIMGSVSFFASEFIQDEEIPKILEAAEEDEAVILWLPVGTCLYEDTFVGKYQAVSDPSKPLEDMNPSDRNKVYTALLNQIKDIYGISTEA